MWPVTTRYLETLKRSHAQVQRLDILKNGQVTASVTGGVLTNPQTTGSRAYFTGGSVAVSSTTIRRSATLTIVDPLGQFTPVSTSDLLAPYVTEIRPWAGVRYWDAAATGASASDFEYVPLGTFVVHDPQLQGNVLTIQGYDRMWYLANFPAPYPISNGTNVADAINGLLTAFVPGNLLSVNIPSTSVTIAGNVLFDADTAVADALAQLALVANWKICCDQLGTFVAYAPPSSSSTPDLVLSPGVGTLMYKPQRQLGTADVVNAVVYTNEGGQNTPLRGFASDTNPQSLTNANVIGVRPTFRSDPTLSTQQQVDSAALTALQLLLGTSDTLTAIMMPLHALDADDVLQVTDTSQGINGMTAVVDNFTMPIRASDGTIQVQCRANVDVSAP